ncbi:hypothetical protein BCR42DRAFT_450015 [Absidia repens]|uniref:Uncharacterized protein n=1 Tax=Absidia repens TaxID=90262 RepID=A0A1X2IM74_9FUNG|nr:hypothetical protein BCR42DRAFT_450015 [Absidia repens]
MLYDQAKKDIFCNSSPPTSQQKQHSHHYKGDQDGNAPINAPSVTTIVLLQVQASMIQVISKLKAQKKGITTVVHVPIRWGLLFGLLVVDNVARALQVDQEMACLQHSDEQTICDANTITEEDDVLDDGSLTSTDDLSVGMSYQQPASYHHQQQPVLQRSQSATTANTKQSQHYQYSSSLYQHGLTTSVSSSPPSSPLLAIRPPMVSQSSEGLRVRPRKTSSPALTNGRPILSPAQQQRAIIGRGPGGGHVRSLSNNLHDIVSARPVSRSTSTNTSTSTTKPSPTVRRITAQRELGVASPPPASSNGLRRQASLHDLNASEKPTKRTQRQHRHTSSTATSQSKK